MTGYQFINNESIFLTKNTKFAVRYVAILATQPIVSFDVASKRLFDKRERLQNTKKTKCYSHYDKFEIKRI